MSGPSVNTDANVDTRIALMEKEFGIVNDMFRKFENAMEKMSEATVTMQRVVAIHEMRLDDREKIEKQIFEGIDRRRDDQDRRERLADERMTKLAVDLKASMSEVVGNLSDKVNDKLETLEEGQEDLAKKFDKNVENVDKEIKALEDRVIVLERWRWLIVGGSAVLGFIVAKLPAIVSLLTPAAAAVGAG